MTRTNTYILLTGTNKEELILTILSAGKSVRAVLLPYTSSREERLQGVIEVAHKARIPVLRPKQQELPDLLQSYASDVLVSAGYPYLLKRDTINICSNNINIHPTLLPRYRGPATTWYIIANGEKQGGVTIHLIDEGMDTGNILVQESFPLGPFDTLKSYMRKAATLEPKLLLRAIEMLDNGFTAGTPQNHERGSTYLQKRTSQDSQIDPNCSVSELYNFIRACDPDRFPAFFEVEGQRVGIKLFRPNRPEDEADML